MLISDFSFNYYVDYPAVRISPDDLQWSMPLPMNRQPSKLSANRSASEITYGDYFQSTGDFLTRHLPFLISTLGGTAETEAASTAIKKVDIHLVKHGAFYHPAKVTVHTDQGKFLMALNVAVGREGRALLGIETANLKRLHHNAICREVLPRVLVQGEGFSPGNKPVPIFAAEWFDGFCEFHICADSGCCEGRAWKVWDENGDWCMTPDQVAALYHRAAFILTACYHPLTFEAVLDWHHAAGDFVVKRSGKEVDVRLVTVRRYTTLCDVPADDGKALADILDAWVLFVLDVTLRIRLDRLDGVGRVVWADDWVVPHVWQGFVQGTGHMAARLDLPADLIDGLFQYLAAHSVEDLIGLGRSVAARLNKLSEETAVIHEHLSGHAALLKDVIEQRDSG